MPGIPQTATGAQDPRMKELRARKEQLLDHLVALDKRSEAETLDRREYARQREIGKRQLRRIAMLLGRK